MNQFKIFVKKEFLHILRDRWTTIIVLILPVVMLLLFGFGISTEMKEVSFGVIRGNSGPLHREIITKLNQSDFFNFKAYYKNIEALESDFRKGELRFGILLPSTQIESKLAIGENTKITFIADGSDPNSATTMINYASGILMQLFNNKSNTMGVNTSPLIKPEIKFLYNPTLKGTYNTVPGIVGMILLLISAIMTSVSIAREKEQGSMELLLVSPLKPIVLILSKVFPYFILLNINLITILLLGHFMFEVPFNGSLIDIYILCEVYLFLCLALGLLISSVANTQLVALLASGMGLILPVVMLSGLIFPIENMPILLQGVSHIIPAKWFIGALKKVMIMGLDLTDIAKEFIILCFMCIALISISFKLFKKRLE